MNQSRRGSRVRVMLGVTVTALLTGAALVSGSSAGASTKAAPMIGTYCPNNYSCYYPGAYFGGNPFKPTSCGYGWNLPFAALSMHNLGHGRVWLYDGNWNYITYVDPGYSNQSLPRAAWHVDIAC